MPQTLDLQDSFVVFQLAGASYGLASSTIQQIEMVEGVTPVPNAPPFVEGVVFSRGHMIPAINLRARFGFVKVPADTKSRLIVVRTAERTVGLIVDSAREFVPIPPSVIQAPPETISGLSGTYLKGIAPLNDRLVLILNLEQILSSVEPILMDLPMEEKP